MSLQTNFPVIITTDKNFFGSLSPLQTVVRVNQQWCWLARHLLFALVLFAPNFLSLT